MVTKFIGDLGQAVYEMAMAANKGSRICPRAVYERMRTVVRENQAEIIAHYDTHRTVKGYRMSGLGRTALNYMEKVLSDGAQSLTPKFESKIGTSDHRNRGKQVNRSKRNGWHR